MQVVKQHSVRTFAVIWFGQLISLVGSEMTGFALGVWVFQRTGSVTYFAVIILCATLPSVLAGPFAGALVDRWDRRLAMMLSDSAAALGTLIVALLFLSGRLEIWHICIVTACTSVFTAFQWPAYASVITLLVPKKHLARANSAVQMADGASRVAAPLLGGVAVVALGLGGVLLIDLATFLLAIMTLLAVRVPRPELSREGQEAQGSLWREALFGWSFLRSRPGLLGLLFLFAVVNFGMSFFLVLTTPMVLSFASAEVLGTVLALGSVGMLAGSSVLTAWGGPSRKRVRAIVLFMAALGICMSVMGIRPNAVLIAAGAFGMMFMTPCVNALSQAIWQVKVAPDVQGRVFAIRFMIAQSAMPLGYLLAGPLADRFFEPWMASPSGWSAALGGLIGTGQGRGIGLMLVLMGALTTLSAATVYFYPRLRHLEEELPDLVAEAPAAHEEGEAEAEAAASA